jgi:HrpA-like RNA helicase
VLGIDDVVGFDYFEAPSAEQLQEALLLLHSLGALDDHGQVGSLLIAAKGIDNMCFTIPTLLVLLAGQLTPLTRL